MKKNNIIITTVTLAIVGLLVANIRVNDNTFLTDLFRQGDSIQTETSLSDNELEYQIPMTSLFNGTSEATKPAHSNSDTPNPAFMDYDDEWCLAMTDLNSKDRDYYQRELDDWRLSKGRVTAAVNDGIGGIYFPDSSQYIAPYMGSSYDAVLQQINSNNKFAMLAALKRQDFNIESKQNIAQQLVINGYTSVLSDLVRVEFVQAIMGYNQTQQLNADIKDHLKRAMAYIAYGIEYYDLDAVLAYLSIVGSDDFPLDLKPRYSLGTDNHVQQYVDSLTQWIDEARDNENLQLPTAEELPKVARHAFEGRLARLYLEFGNELSDLKATLPKNTSTMLDRSECVERQVVFFGDLERRARSSIK